MNIKNKFKNASIRLECLLLNKFTLVAIILIVVSIILEIAGYYFKIPGYYFITIPLLIIGYFILYMFNFGYASYDMYHRTFNHMKKYEVPVINANTYCSGVGVRVAERRFKRQYPKVYTEILEKKKNFEYKETHIPGFFFIEIHFRERNL